MLTPGEKNDILDAFVNKKKTIQAISKEFGRDCSTIARLLKDYKPTTLLARASLQARASELVDRVLEKADVDQLIDILQRPNIGVLDPVAPRGGGGGTNVGILVSVTPASLPAVDAATYTDGKPVLQAGEDIIEGKSVRVGGAVVGQLAGE